MDTRAQRRARIRKAFSAAETYDDHAHVQRLAANWLIARLSTAPPLHYSQICEIGCGTGFLGEEVRGRISFDRFLATDLSAEMIERARFRLGPDDRFAFALLDGEHPHELAEKAPFDLICSNLTAQWFSDLGRAVRRLVTFLRLGGRLTFTTLAAGSFQEWRQAHADLGLPCGTPQYPTAGDLLLMVPPGMVGTVEVRDHLEHFASGSAFVRSLHAIGANTPRRGHLPLNAGQMRRVLSAFDHQPQITYKIAICDFQR